MRIIVLAIAVGLWCCAAPKATTQQQQGVPAVVNQKLGEGAQSFSNRDGSFTLYRKEEKSPSNGMPVTKFIVLRNGDQRVVEEGSVTIGNVEWTADYEITISQSPGQVQLERKENSSMRKIDLRPYRL